MAVAGFVGCEDRVTGGKKNASAGEASRASEARCCVGTGKSACATERQKAKGLRSSRPKGRDAEDAKDLSYIGGALLGEEFGLCGGGGGGLCVAREAAGHADDAEDFHFGESRARDEHAQVVAMQVGRSELYTAIEHFEQIVGENSFDLIVIAEAQADPQAVELRAAEEGLALRFEVSAELPNEVDGLDLVERQGTVLTIGGEELDAVRVSQGRRVQIAADSGLIELHDNDFLECRGRRTRFDGFGCGTSHFSVLGQTSC